MPEQTLVVDVCRTPEGGAQANTVVVCLWCECELPQLVSSKKLTTTLKAGAASASVKKLHAHLERFGMRVELSDWKNGKFEESADLKNGAWAAPTTRAVRMFARHPAVQGEAERILKLDGKSVTPELVAKLQDWCRKHVASPQNYWEFAQLSLRSGDLDCLGAQSAPEKQTALHDFVAQVERDLCKTGFGVHDDVLCSIKRTHKPAGVYAEAKKGSDGLHDDRNLGDVTYLVRKFQRQAKWLWRMKADGSAPPDAQPGDPTLYTGPVDGVMSAQTAAALHAWASRDLHMVLKKFALATLEWPPGSGTAIANSDGGSAQLRQDAQEAWLRAAQRAQGLGATLAGPYASSPRGWRGGKPKKAAASAYSWHYSGLAVDLGRPLQFGDGTLTDKAPYGLEKDGLQFRIWCWASPQPPAPEAPSEDKADALKQYRNRNLRTKVKKGSANEKKDAKLPSDPAPLYLATVMRNAAGTDVEDVTAKEGWYVDVTAILEAEGLKRINRRGSWLTDPEGWEWWHYQYEPALPPGAVDPPTFGEYLQLYGVHEALLRAVDWSRHEDIEHKAG